ncbi:MAG: hypothetical protein WKF43_07295 [Acidimicrobiales bacterium]
MKYMMKDDVWAWFVGQVPDDWFSAPLDVTVDREEILVTGTVSEPALGETGDTEDAGGEARSVACSSRIARFREDTRDQRIRVAAEAEGRFGRKVSWAVRCGAVEAPFTTASVPVMTRLRMPERSVLDTLIDAGVARSRSEALSWCVRLVGRHQGEWIDQLQDALGAVREARAAGPDLAS